MKEFVAGILFVFLLLCMLTFGIQPVKTEPTTIMVPDGKVDMLDIALIARNYGEIYSQ